MNIYEKIYEKKHLNRVIHTTLNPDKVGAVRIHLVPAKFSLFRARPSIVILDGKDISKGLVIFINEGQENDYILEVLKETTGLKNSDYLKRLNACDVYYLK